MRQKKLRLKLRELKKLIKELLDEGPSGPGVTADPTSSDGFYPYELKRGVDIQGFWYRSPGRTPGSDGDPGRPADAAEYIGFMTKGATPEDAAEEAKPEEIMPQAE